MSQTATNTASKCYQHSNKAGNRGDVWKHYALARILATDASRGVDAYVETHAGGGVYELEETNREREWGRGILRVVRQPAVADEPFQKALKGINPSLDFPGPYPGSAFVASKCLPGRRQILFETDPNAAKKLRLWIPEADVREEDGYSGLTSLVRQEAQQETRSLVFIDPPYKKGREELWEDVPKRLTTLRDWLSHSTLAVWYPVYNTYLNLSELCAKYCQASGLPAWVVECIVDTPSRNLNGSGLLVLNLPNPKLYDELVSLAACLADLMKCEGEQPGHSRYWCL